MKQRKNFLLYGLILALVIGAVAGFELLLDHVPDFYREAELVPGNQRLEQSQQFSVKAYTVGILFREPVDPEPWQHSFTQEQINSFLEEEFGDGAKSMEKLGIAAPRVIIEQDKLRLAFRYKNALMSTVMSLDLRVWIVPSDTNVIAIEILGRHAGSVPFPVRGMQEEITNLARMYKMETTWYRHEGHPVGLLHLRSDGHRPPSKLNRLDLQPGQLVIGGVSLEPVNAKTNVPPATQMAPAAN